MCVETLITWPYMPGCRSRRGLPKAGTTVVKHFVSSNIQFHRNIFEICAERRKTEREVGETGYGCHTFYITDVSRNIVILADIRLLLCLNIVSCAHINMQCVSFAS